MAFLLDPNLGGYRPRTADSSFCQHAEPENEVHMEENSQRKQRV